MAAETTSIGLGPIQGRIWDRRRQQEVPLRTRPAFVGTFARGYTVEGDRVRLKTPGGQGTQFWHKRPASNGGLHRAEDVYVRPGAPVHAPFAGVVEALYAARAGTFEAECAACGTEYGQVVVFRSDDDPRIALRLIHLHRLVVRKGQRLRPGQRIGDSYTNVQFPGKDPSHTHVEAVLALGEDAGATKGTHQPFSVFDVEALYDPSRAYGGAAASPWTLGVGGVLGALAAVGLYAGWRWHRERA